MDVKNNKIIMAARFFERAFGQYKPQIILLTVLGFFSGFLEGIGINALIPFFGLVLGGSGTEPDLVSRSIVRLFNYFHLSFSLEYLLIFICLLFIFKSAIMLVCLYIRTRTSADYEEKARGVLFEKTIKADWPYLSKQKLGHLEMVILTDITQGSRFLLLISNSIMLITSLIIYLAIALNIEFRITVVVLAASAFLILIFRPLIYKTRALARETSGLMKTISNFVNEHITGVKTMKTLFVESEVSGIAKGYFARFRQLKIMQELIRSVAALAIEPISLIFIAVIFAVSHRAPDFNFAALATVIYLIYKIFAYTSSLQGQWQSMSEAIPYLANALDNRDEAIKHKEDNTGSDKFKFEKILELKNISFSYEEKKNVLSDVSFTIKNREMVGLIGPSGAGKTTVVDLILRLLEPRGGEILLDEKNIRNIDVGEWRKNIGYVSQDLFLKNDTFENNIKFYDKSISDGEMAKAARTAFIYDVIESCRDGFKTIVGERGMELSAGQRQRVVLARILARRPQLLILDEATSSLDNESEVEIQRAIERLRGETTILVIAHRLSTIMNCDKIVSLKDGKIVEQGTPYNLLQDSNSYFYKVHNIRKIENG